MLKVLLHLRGNPGSFCFLFVSLDFGISFCGSGLAFQNDIDLKPTYSFQLLDLGKS